MPNQISLQPYLDIWSCSAHVLGLIPSKLIFEWVENIFFKAKETPVAYLKYKLLEL